MSKVGRKRAYHRFDKDFKSNLTRRQKLYLEANYGKGVYGAKKYKEVIQELNIIEEGSITDIDLLVAKREFMGDKRIFNKVKANPNEEVLMSDSLANENGEVLNSYIPLNNNYLLAYLTIPGYNNSPIQAVKIITRGSLGGFTYEQ